jgi:hypothetical protein
LRERQTSPRAHYKYKPALEKCFGEKDLMTLFGELIVAGKRGLIGKTISMVSNFLPFPQGRANWRRFKKNLRIFCRSIYGLFSKIRWFACRFLS